MKGVTKTGQAGISKYYSVRDDSIDGFSTIITPPNNTPLKDVELSNGLKRHTYILMSGLSPAYNRWAKGWGHKRPSPLCTLIGTMLNSVGCANIALL